MCVCVCVCVCVRACMRVCVCVRVCACASQSEHVITQLLKIFPSDGLLPIFISPDTGAATSEHVSFGAMGDRWVLGQVGTGARYTTCNTRAQWQILC